MSGSAGAEAFIARFHSIIKYEEYIAVAIALGMARNLYSLFIKYAKFVLEARPLIQAFHMFSL